MIAQPSPPINTFKRIILLSCIDGLDSLVIIGLVDRYKQSNLGVEQMVTHCLNQFAITAICQSDTKALILKITRATLSAAKPSATLDR